jgi:hypothetical protein
MVALIPASRDMDIVATANPPKAGTFDAAEEAQTELPWGRPALEMATMIGLTLSIAGAIARNGQPEPGRITSGILLVVYALSWMIPDSYRPWAAPLDQRWDTGAKWWWAALILVWVSALTISWDSRVSESLLPRASPQHLASI